MTTYNPHVSLHSQLKKVSESVNTTVNLLGISAGVKVVQFQPLNIYGKVYDIILTRISNPMLTTFTFNIKDQNGNFVFKNLTSDIIDVKIKKIYDQNALLC